MRNVIVVLVVIVSCVGCTSRAARLSTSNPESKSYVFYFGKMLLDYKSTKGMPISTAIKEFESQLNIVLSSNKNTQSCSVKVGSINFGEPGSTGTAIANCSAVVQFFVEEGSFTGAGQPFYYFDIIE